MYEIREKFITKNRSYKALMPQGIVVHETANPGGTAEAHYKYFNRESKGASAHAFVDWNEIIQTIPWGEQSWHAGAYANSRFIGIELCRPAKFDKELFNKIWDRGIWLFSYLFTTKLNIKTVTEDNLLSHDEVRLKYGGTTHTDPTSYFKEYGKVTDDFRKAVQSKINEAIAAEKPVETVSDWAKDAYLWVKEKGISDGTRPKEVVTREELWTMIYRMKGI